MSRFEWFIFCILLHYACTTRANKSLWKYVVYCKVIRIISDAFKLLLSALVKLKAERNYRDAIVNGKY